MPNTFRKPEHLCSQKAIDELFEKSTGSLRMFPFLAVYRKVARTATEPPVCVLLSVSKRRFRHAVDRNRVKRLLREAYRVNKQPLFAALGENEGLHLAFVWIGNKLPAKNSLPPRMEQTIAALVDKLNEGEERKEETE